MATVVRSVADELLNDAAAALKRFEAPEDTEALHDFRVAVRRLRSMLRAFRPWIGKAASKKIRRRLRDLARATTAGRDAEVEIAWLEAQRSALARRDRAGFEWLLERLGQARDEAYANGGGRLAREFGKLEAALRPRLAAADGEDDPTFGTVVSSLITDHAVQLGECLATVRTVDDEEEAHAARIAAKRLRYLMEPAVPALPDGKRLVKQLKGLQDILGDLHDLHVLLAGLADATEEVAAEKARRMHALAREGEKGERALARERRRDERHGLLALTRLAEEAAQERFAALAEGWLSGRGSAFLESMVDAVRPLAGPGAPPEEVEIERKYLLSGLPPEARAVTPTHITQGWLPGTRLQERLRRTDRDGETHYYRTVKLGSGMVRTEIEEETSADLFDALWPLTAGRRVTKQRYRCGDGAFTWEVDAFDDRDLVLAEVELPTAETAVHPPEWLSPYVVRDVTGDAAYLNVNLAR